MSVLHDQLKDLFKKSNDIKERIDFLYQRKKEFSDNIASSHLLVLGLNSKISKEYEMLNHYKAILERLYEDKNTLVSEKKELFESLNEVKNELANAIDWFKTKKSQLDDLYFRKNSLCEELDSVKTAIQCAYDNKYYYELDDLKQQKSDLGRYIGEVNDEIRPLKEEVSELSSQISTLKSDKAEIVSKLEVAKEKLTDVCNQIEYNKNEKSKHSTNLDLYKKEREGLYLIILDYKNQKNSCQSEIDELKAKRVQIFADIDKTKEKIEEEKKKKY